MFRCSLTGCSGCSGLEPGEGEAAGESDIVCRWMGGGWGGVVEPRDVTLEAGKSRRRVAAREGDAFAWRFDCEGCDRARGGAR